MKSPGSGVRVARQVRPGGWAACAAVGYTVLAVGLFWSAWRTPVATYIGEGGDPQQAMWFLTWTPFALGHGHSPWFSDFMNHPAGVNLMWNTAQPLLGLATAPLGRWFGIITIFNIIVTGSVVASAGAACLCIHHWVPNRVAAFLGGLLYGFSPYMVAQALGHSNLTFIATPPLFLLLLDDLLVRRRRRWWVNGLLLGALASVQFYVSEEILAMEVVLAAVSVAILAGSHRDQLWARSFHVLRTLAVAGLVGVGLCGPALNTQFFGPQQLHGRPQGYDVFVADLLNFVVPTTLQAVAPGGLTAISKHFAQDLSEANAYLGLPLGVLLLVLAVRSRRGSWERAAAVLGIVAAVFSMGAHLHIRGHRTPVPLPWVLPAHLPLLDSILTCRFALFVALAAGLLFAGWFGRAWSGSWWHRAAALGLTALIVATLLPRTPYRSQTVAVPRFFVHDVVARVPEGCVVLVAPVPAGSPSEPLLWQAESKMRFRLLGGYFLGPPPPRDDVQALLDDLTGIETTGHLPVGPAIDRDRHGLSLAHVGRVVVGPDANRARFDEYFITLLGASPIADEGVDLWSVSAWLSTDRCPGTIGAVGNSGVAGA